MLREWLLSCGVTHSPAYQQLAGGPTSPLWHSAQASRPSDCKAGHIPGETASVFTAWSFPEADPSWMHNAEQDTVLRGAHNCRDVYTSRCCHTEARAGPYGLRVRGLSLITRSRNTCTVFPVYLCRALNNALNNPALAADTTGPVTHGKRRHTPAYQEEESNAAPPIPPAEIASRQTSH